MQIDIAIIGPHCLDLSYTLIDQTGEDMNMDISILLARIFGVYLALMAIAMLMHKERCNAIMANIESNAGVSTLATVFTLLLGLLLVNMHNLWVQDWRVVITVLAWITLVKGVAFLFVPEHMMTYHRALHMKGVCGVKEMVVLVVGVFLLYHGYYLGA
jgi:hypothetical protein